MCSISGLITNQPSPDLTKQLFDVIVKAEERGRDGFGIASPLKSFRWLSKPSMVIADYDKITIPETLVTNVVLNNNRAEPTTEFVAKKTKNDVQPFEFVNVIVAHNGTIANDKELKSKYEIETNTYIDSSVIAPLVHRLGVQKAVEELVGSYAMAIYYKGLVYLVCNYKPIFIKRMQGAFLFSSLDRYLRTSWMDNIVKLPPYSMTTIDPETLEVKTVSLRPSARSKKVLVICSGGMDSVVTATHYVREGTEVTLLHFTYGCRAEIKEIDAIKATAQYLNVPYKLIDVSSVFRSEIGGSPLLSDEIPIMSDRKGESGAELAYEWVPARNLVFYSLALAYAEAHGYSTIALGNNLEESGSYADNEMIFAEQFGELIPNAVNLNVDIVVEQPVGNLMKHEIVAYGLEIKAPFQHTWSCYEAGAKHCGVCGPCYMRKKAFEMNNQIDPVFV